MSLTKNELMNELYNAGLITLGAVGVSMGAKKLIKDDLGVTPRSLNSVLKLGAAVGTSAVLVKLAQKSTKLPDKIVEWINDKRGSRRNI